MSKYRIFKGITYVPGYEVLNPSMKLICTHLHVLLIELSINFDYQKDIIKCLNIADSNLISEF
jgi:hypothetical protein